MQVLGAIAFPWLFFAVAIFGLAWSNHVPRKQRGDTRQPDNPQGW